MFVFTFTVPFLWADIPDTYFVEESEIFNELRSVYGLHVTAHNSNNEKVDLVLAPQLMLLMAVALNDDEKKTVRFEHIYVKVEAQVMTAPTNPPLLVLTINDGILSKYFQKTESGMTMLNWLAYKAIALPYYHTELKKAITNAKYEGIGIGPGFMDPQVHSMRRF